MGFASMQKGSDHKQEMMGGKRLGLIELYRQIY